MTTTIWTLLFIFVIAPLGALAFDRSLFGNWIWHIAGPKLPARQRVSHDSTLGAAGQWGGAGRRAAESPGPSIWGGLARRSPSEEAGTARPTRAAESRSRCHSPAARVNLGENQAQRGNFR